MTKQRILFALSSYIGPVALLLMAAAGFFDIKQRRFPNWLFIALFILGVYCSYINDHLVSSAVYFLVVSLFSVFVLFGHFGLKAGDLKFFSCLFWFFDPGKWGELKLFACVFIGGLTVFGLIHLLMDKGSVKGLFKEMKLQTFEMGQMLVHPTRNTTYYSEHKTIPLVAEMAVLFGVFSYLRGDLSWIF